MKMDDLRPGLAVWVTWGKEWFAARVVERVVKEGHYFVYLERDDGRFGSLAKRSPQYLRPRNPELAGKDRPDLIGV